MNATTDYLFFGGTKPRIIGHRGAAGDAPENTLVSFQKAFDDGAGYVELDVHGTKEGGVVIIHDASVDRTTEGQGWVSGKTFAELKALDAGYRFTRDGGKSFPYRGQGIQIPTLEELFDAFADLKLIIEIKSTDTAIAEKVIDTIVGTGKENRVLLATEHDQVMNEARRIIRDKRAQIATGFSYGEVAMFIRQLQADCIGDFAVCGQAFQLPLEYAGTPLVNAASVKAAHQLGLEMFVWTINDVNEMKRLLALGVDGVITDYPARMRRLLSNAPA